MLVTWSKGYIVLRVGTRHVKSGPCLVSCPWVFCKWRYNLFNLSRDLTKPPHLGVMQIYGLEFLVVCHHPDKRSDHRHCVSGDMLLICHMTSRD